MTSSSHRTRVSRVTSPAGFEIWHAEDYTVPLVSMEFAVLGGAAQDPAGRAGLASFLAGLLDEGAGPLKAEAFQEALEEKAIELAFGASRDRLTGSMRTLTEHADSAFDLLALAIREPRFDPDAIERVRSQIISGLKRDETDPQSLTRDALNRLAFANHPYGLPTDGSIPDVQAITRDELRNQHARLFGRDVLRIVSVGAISAEALAAGVDRVFGDLSPQAKLAPVPEIAMQSAGHIEIVDLDVPQSTLFLALPGVSRRDPDFMAAYLANHVLGGGAFTSRLWHEVRETRGLAYSVWSSLRWSAHTKLFMAGTATSNERVAESLRVMRAEISRMGAEGPTGEELAKAKSYLTGSYALQFDTSRKIADHLLSLRMDGLPIDYIDRRNQDVEAATLDAVKAAARRLYADIEPLVVVTGRPQGLA
ncbi:MAG: insulinase family protein [Methylobacterium sp.]|nr:insulinase family protein [Methylobacterium sp.]